MRHADTASSAERSTASYSQTPLENQEVMQALTSTLSDPTGALTVKVKRFTISRDRDEPSTSPPSSATSEIIYHMFFGTNMDPKSQNLRIFVSPTFSPKSPRIEPKTHWFVVCHFSVGDPELSQQSIPLWHCSEGKARPT